MQHLIRKIQEVGITNVIWGGVKREYYKILQRKFNFDTWHISPYELRKYVQAVAEYVNSKNADVVVDIGCGLGEMLRHIHARVRIGLDLHEEAIRAAKKLSRGDIVFQVGTFDNLQIEESIDYLITLGFMHGGTEKAWKSCYHDVARRNNVKHFIVDTVPEEGNSHFLDFTLILPDEYKLIDRLGPFLAGRYIEVYEKADC